MRPGGLEDGDIVAIRPAGFVWGAEEIKRFMIVQANLTEEEASTLTSSEELTKADKNGRPVREIIKERRYKIDFTKKELADRGVGNMKGRLAGAPVSRKTFVDKNVSK